MDNIGAACSMAVIYCRKNDRCSYTAAGGQSDNRTMHVGLRYNTGYICCVIQAYYHIQWHIILLKKHP